MNAAMRGIQLNVEVGLITETCCACGVLFAMTADLKAELQRSHKLFFCPNGHQQHYTGESDKDRAARLQRELEAQERRTLRVEAELDQANANAARVEKARKKLEREQAATLRRVTNGVCTECHRTFKQVAAHMQRKHLHAAVSHAEDR